MYLSKVVFDVQPVSRLVASVVQDENNRKSLIQPMDKIRAVKPERNVVALAAARKLVSRFHLNADVTCLWLSIRIKGEQKEVISIIVENSLNGVAA